jgi:hypothetical protein
MSVDGNLNSPDGLAAIHVSPLGRMPPGTIFMIGYLRLQVSDLPADALFK